jgi:predicted GIY-YIG superfamily endonuclease
MEKDACSTKRQVKHLKRKKKEKKVEEIVPVSK